MHLCKMMFKFLSKFLFLLFPIFAGLSLLFVHHLIESNRSVRPQYKAPAVEDSWSAEDYIRHLNVRPFNQGEVHRLLLKRTRQKQGVYLESISPLMDTVGLEVVSCYHQVMGDDYTPVITSGNDFPGHARNSKHYRNAAFDFRIKDVPFRKRKELVELVKSRIDGRCTVLWERGEAEHLHVELKESEISR